MKILTILFISILFFSTSSFAAKKYLLDGEWVLNKQTNCEDPILKLTIKKNRIKADKLKGKVYIKKNSLKLGKDLKGTFSSNTSFQLTSRTSECVYEFTKEPDATEDGAESFNTSSNTKALAGIYIENDPNIDFFKPPLKPYPTDNLYWFGRMWQIADFNNDGYSDVLYIGTMNPNNVDSIGEDTGGSCGGGACKGNKPLPSLYLGDANKQLTYSPELLIDNREDSGMSLGRQLLVADYNIDKL